MVVITPNDHDVIRGRGNGANLHPGNIRFRALVKTARAGYALSSNADKRKYVDCIVQHIRSLDPPGRFLDKDEDGRWFVMDDRKANKKTRQALREGVPAIVKAHNDKFNKVSFRFDNLMPISIDTISHIHLNLNRCLMSSPSRCF